MAVETEVKACRDDNPSDLLLLYLVGGFFMENLLGKKFNRLTVVKDSKRRDSSGNIYWDCLCECGGTTQTTRYHLKNGNTTSCGCYFVERITKHGKSGTRTYMSWAYMKNRCLSKNNTEYKNYGGRGITVCDEWLDFENFYKDMGDQPTTKHEIDRIDVNGNYEPSNCRWVTKSLNIHNKRKSNGCTSKYKGVVFRKDTSKWSSSISKDGKTYSLGCYDTEEEAAEVYNNKSLELFGDKPNDINS